jgi:hypothetical protein
LRLVHGLLCWLCHSRPGCWLNLLLPLLLCLALLLLLHGQHLAPCPHRAPARWPCTQLRLLRLLWLLLLLLWVHACCCNGLCCCLEDWCHVSIMLGHRQAHHAIHLQHSSI